MTRVSILAFDLFPWRQSRMKLAKTLQMGQTPWWVKWAHLDACTHICGNRPEVPSFRLNWPADNSCNQNKSIQVNSRGNCTVPSLRIACLYMQTVSERETELILTRFSSHRQHHHPCNPTLQTYQLAAMDQFVVWQGRNLCCLTLCFSFLIKHLAELRGMSEFWRGALWHFLLFFLFFYSL